VTAQGYALPLAPYGEIAARAEEGCPMTTTTTTCNTLPVDRNTLSSTERSRKLRERRRRGISLFTVRLTHQELEAVAARGYPGAFANREEAVGAVQAFVSDMLLRPVELPSGAMPRATTPEDDPFGPSWT
jgi:hypothetical protein